MVNERQSEKAEYWGIKHSAYEIFIRLNCWKLKSLYLPKKKKKKLHIEIPAMCISVWEHL